MKLTFPKLHKYIYLNHSNLRVKKITNVILKISTSENVYGILHCICMLIPRQLSQTTMTRNPVIYIWGLVCNTQYEVNPKSTESQAFIQKRPTSNTEAFPLIEMK